MIYSNCPTHPRKPFRFRLFSDLHFEFRTSIEEPQFDLSRTDLVILAGDIHKGIEGIFWAQRNFRDVPVVYVAGNHEFYHQDHDQVRDALKRAAAGSNVSILDNSGIELPAVRVVGATLWTDFNLAGPHRKPRLMADAAQLVKDFSRIRVGNIPLTAWHTEEWCSQSCQWLDAEINKAEKPLIVVTHHGPSTKTIHRQFIGDESNAFFNSDFEHLLRPPVRLWVHGHTHDNFDVLVDGVRVLTHQRGYPDHDAAGFDWNREFVVDLAP